MVVNAPTRRRRKDDTARPAQGKKRSAVHKPASTRGEKQAGGQEEEEPLHELKVVRQELVSEHLTPVIGPSTLRGDLGE